jgi:hypothetical protein
MKKIAHVLLLIILSTFLVQAQSVTKTGTTAAPFLNVGVGARAIGMGGAFVSLADDASSLFWNPAGAAYVQGSEAIFNHSEWIADINFDFAGLVVNLGNIGTVGMFGNFMTMGEMERTTELYPDGTGQNFSAGSYALGLNYSRALTDRFNIGFNIKYVHEYILNSSASGLAIDIGTVFVTGFKGLRLGASITNFGTKMSMDGRDVLVQHDIDPLREGSNERLNANLDTDAYDMPLNLRVGVSYDVFQDISNNQLWIAVDALHPSDNVEFINAGLEYVALDLFALRGGYAALFSDDSERGLTLGGGVKYGFGNTLSLKVDYAFETFGRLDNVHKFTLGLLF